LIGLSLAPLPTITNDIENDLNGWFSQLTQIPGVVDALQLVGFFISDELEMSLSTGSLLSSTSDRATNNHDMLEQKSQGIGLKDFILIKVIGKGSFGKVMLVKKRGSNVIYAMKVLDKGHIIRRNQVEHTKTERHVLELMDHPFLVKMHYAFQNRRKLYFVLEFCPGGELFFHLGRAGKFSENRTRFYAAELLLALEHVHSKRVVYRDLKPENVLLDAEGHIKITDFGLCKEVHIHIYIYRYVDNFHSHLNMSYLYL